MSIYESNVNIGSTPNDGTGDPIRSALLQTNENFLYISNYLDETMFRKAEIDAMLVALQQNLFSNVNVSGNSPIIADSANDTLTLLTRLTDLSFTTNPTNMTVTIANATTTTTTTTTTAAPTTTTTAAPTTTTTTTTAAYYYNLVVDGSSLGSSKYEGEQFEFTLTTNDSRSGTWTTTTTPSGVVSILTDPFTVTSNVGTFFGYAEDVPYDTAVTVRVFRNIGAGPFEVASIGVTVRNN